MGVNQPRVYLDSCIIIYLVEEHPTYAPQLENRLLNAGSLGLAFSALSEMECLVMPLRNRNQALIDKFRGWFQQAEFLLLERGVFQRASILRADYPSLKTPDAIHLAAARRHGCIEFWTNDDRLNAIAPSLVKNVIRP
jgi:uncharacterized protein